MTDPLAEVVSLLQPTAGFSKLVSARGPWRVTRAEAGQPFYTMILEGRARCVVDGRTIVLEQGDFILVPSSFERTMSSIEPAKKDTLPVKLPNGEHRQGLLGGTAEMRMLIGHCQFGSPDAALLVSLLPSVVLIHGQQRLATLVDMLRDESRERRPARDVVLSRLLEVLLIEALRSAGTAATPGLLRGLGDEHLALAIRAMHASPTKPWTIAQLAKAAGLSRSTFFERFNNAVGVAPMEYLLGWRMALAKDLLRRKLVSMAEVAQHVGYSSASTFSVAFTRTVGMPPTEYARQQL